MGVIITATKKFNWFKHINNTPKETMTKQPRSKNLELNQDQVIKIQEVLKMQIKVLGMQIKCKHRGIIKTTL